MTRSEQRGIIRIRRAYEPPAPADGKRVLVDRLWPRGLARKTAALDFWLKDIAPTPALRKWFGHDPSRFAVFAKRYREELDANSDAVADLCEIADSGDVTLLYAAHDKQVNHALVLAEYLEERGYRFDRAA